MPLRTVAGSAGTTLAIERDIGAARCDERLATILIIYMKRAEVTSPILARVDL
jgi:hypothetical protein